MYNRETIAYIFSICKKANSFYTDRTILIKETMDFNQAKELMKLQQEAQNIQEELSNTHIEAEFDGVVVTIDGQLKVVKVHFENTDILKDEARLANAIKEATNKGMKKAQEIAAEKMKWVMGKMGLDIPGMS